MHDKENASLQNYGAYLEKEVAGISEAKLVGLSTGDVELTNQEWEYQVETDTATHPVLFGCGPVMVKERI